MGHRVGRQRVARPFRTGQLSCTLANSITTSIGGSQPLVATSRIRASSFSSHFILGHFILSMVKLLCVMDSVDLVDGRDVT